MRRRGVGWALAFGLFMGLPGLAPACPVPDGQLLFHSCWGEAEAALILLPEQADILETNPNSAERLFVTGAYTGKDRRGENLPKPVGLFVHDGVIINPNLGRMDGIVTIDSKTGRLAIHHRTQVSALGLVFDLSAAETRLAFAEQARAAGLSVMQSHLLISNGTLDVRPQGDAPVHVRRLLMSDQHGIGVLQTREAVTLFDAAFEAHRTYKPRMVLNLDMGSYDYCLRTSGQTNTICGVLGRRQTDRLSNLLAFRWRPES